MKSKSFVLLGLSLFSLFASAQELPTMGWSSWNTYRVHISDSLICSQADAMVSTGLQKAGYCYINIDDGYFGGRDRNGRLLTHPARFPQGLRPVVDYIHAKGLKAGIYSDAGRNTCGSYYDKDTLGVGVGFYGHDQQDADFFFREMNFDFIKVDFCGGSGHQNAERLTLDEQTRYTAIHEAIRKTGRTDVRLNVCRWNYPGTWVHDIAASWRISQDIRNSFSSVANIIKQNLYLSAYAYGGRFNDMDMLEVGRGMSWEEDRTHFGMWCMLSSPLLIGCDLTKINNETLNLLKNEELLALNQDPLALQAYVVEQQQGAYILTKDIKTLQGKQRALAVYNPSKQEVQLSVAFRRLDLAGKVSVRDLFEKRPCGVFTDSLTVTVPAHGTCLYLLEAQKRLARACYEAETAYISNYQELRNNQSACTGVYEEDAACSGGAKATWLGGSEENDLQWRNVYCTRGGNYTLTVGYLTPEPRSLQLAVNGQTVQSWTLRPGQGGEVQTVTCRTRLKKGNNLIRLSNPTDRMPDIDYLTVVK